MCVGAEGIRFRLIHIKKNDRSRQEFIVSLWVPMLLEHKVK